jgi:hypothetical protein
MSGWQIAVSAVGSFLVYGALAVWVGYSFYSITWARYRWHVDHNPERHKPGLRYEDRCHCDPPFMVNENAAIAGFVWPIGIWLLIGLHLVFRADQRRTANRELDAIRRELEQL